MDKLKIARGRIRSLSLWEGDPMWETGQIEGINRCLEIIDELMVEEIKEDNEGSATNALEKLRDEVMVLEPKLGLTSEEIFWFHQGWQAALAKIDAAISARIY
jgi:hypothetical protein